MTIDGKIPKTANKRTRSSSSLTSSPKPSNETLTLTPPSTDLTLETLLSTLPGCRTQILEILRSIGPENSPMLPFLLYGGKSTGKTSTILQIVKHLDRSFVYTSSRSCYIPRILFESVPNQLLSHRSSDENRYSSTKRCERASEFVNLLSDAIVQWKKKMGSEKRMVYLAFDNVELIRLWDKNGSVLWLLFKINDILRISEVGCVYISSLSPDGYHLSTGSIEPITVYFPDYTVEDLHGIFMRKQANPKLYSSFLGVHEHQLITKMLWHKKCL